MLTKFRRPSPAMLVACLALFLGFAGTGFAAVNYAQNANHVDGKNAFTSHRSNDHVAGGLVATYPGGRLKGKLAHRFLADTPTSRPFKQQFDVFDGSTGDHELLSTSSGALSVTCDDASPGPGLDPVSKVSFGTDQVTNLQVVGRAGDQPPVFGTSGRATVTLDDSDTFEFVATSDRSHAVLVEGAVRHVRTGTDEAQCHVYGTGIEMAP